MFKYLGIGSTFLLLTIYFQNEIEVWIKTTPESLQWILDLLSQPDAPPSKLPPTTISLPSSCPLPIRAKFIPTSPRQPAYYIKEFQVKLDNLTHSSLTAGNTLKLLKNSESFDEKMRLISEAKHTLFITSLAINCCESLAQVGAQFVSSQQICGIETTTMGKFIKELISAQQRGVDVRIILDSGLVWRTYEGNCVKQLKKHGVQIAYTPFFALTQHFQNHEKLFIVDGEIAITGGQNISPWWFESNGLDDNFRDTDIRVEGPAVRPIGLRFARMWRRLEPDDITLDKYTHLLYKQDEWDQENKLVGVAHYHDWLSNKRPGLCRFIAQDPYLNTHYVLDAYKALAQVTQHRIMMHVPELNARTDLDTIELLEIINQLASQDRPPARVNLITNGIGFVKGRIFPFPAPLKYAYALHSTHRLFHDLKGSTTEIYTHRAWIHSKVFSFDDIVVSVGSFNFDHTATQWSESVLICMDPDLSVETIKLFETDIANSLPLGALDCY